MGNAGRLLPEIRTRWFGDDKDELVTNGTVVLVPDASKRSNRALFKQASPDRYGHSKLTGLNAGLLLA